MTDQNPYEAPQSELNTAPRSEPERPYPALINYALVAQLFCIAAMILFSLMSVAPQAMAQHRMTLFVLLLTIALLAALLVAVGLRYRIGWLLVAELVLFGLPLAGFMASFRQ